MPDEEQPSVLGGLSSSRPERLGAPRGNAKKRAVKRKPAKPAARNGHGPRAVRAASPPLKSHRAKPAPPPQPIGAPKGTELVTTTIRAAGELTQIGFTVTGQILKRAVDRIPRP
ncbi:MAG TPA: hypothetical protein VNO33_13685 [Kofleriaceae bacterium]|nr:hypothetical protein [Kofleriaceae bacterium]